MIYFIAPYEGARFIRIERKGSMRPKDVVRMLLWQHASMDRPKFAAVFRCGMIYDCFYDKQQAGVKTNWRHCLSGGRKKGKERYKELLSLDLPTEYIVN